DLNSMMVQHEEFVTGHNSKRTVDPLALAVVPFGGSNFSSSQQTPYSQPPTPHYSDGFQQEYHQEYHQDVNPEYHHQNPNDPAVISVTDEELLNMHDSLALISQKMQHLTAHRGLFRPDRYGQGRGGHNQQGGRFQSNDFGRGYQSGNRYPSFDQGRNDQGRFRGNRSRDSTFIDYQGGSSYQGGWRAQDQDFYYQGNNRGQGYGPGYQGQRFEGNS